MIRALLIAVAATCLAGMASAATVSSTGDFLQIAAPASVGNGSPGSNTNILYFNEAQGFLLTQDLAVDGGGVIAAGTRVDSHMFFLNRISGSTRIERSGTLTFATSILGTMSDLNGALLDASDYLGAPGTSYQSGFNNRGLEDNDTLSILGPNTISATLLVTQPGDWVRVVTISAIPLPAAITLLPLGLGGLVLLRRRRRKAA